LVDFLRIFCFIICIMIKADFHTHTSFSGDSDAPMAQMAAAAVKNGLDSLCITEHMDIDYPTDQGTPAGFFEFDTSAYRQRYLEVREEFKDRLNLLWGVEMGLQTHIAKEIKDYVNQHPFDFVIGSSHLCHGIDLYYPAFYEGRPEEESYREYFGSILENIQAISDFDVYGHLDYAVRYGPNQNKYYTYEKYSDILDPILKKLIEMGKGIEVNTKGLLVGLKEPNPSFAILKRYREFGGEIITCGSDAHAPEYTGYLFDTLADILTDCGYKYYTVFKERKPEFRKIL